mmetsp:Transcript_6113/g.21667  ORF Transcript_6113/g.21667 Transcript_6113/m.21667 type:complete len:222 (-) Transcript_6113:3561-4226(-)
MLQRRHAWLHFIRHKRDAVIVPARDLLDAHGAQGSHELRHGRVGIVPEAELPAVVAPPRVDLLVLHESHRVTVPTEHVTGAAASEVVNDVWLQHSLVAPVQPQLAVGVAPPGVDLVGIREDEGVLAPAGSSDADLLRHPHHLRREVTRLGVAMPQLPALVPPPRPDRAFDTDRYRMELSAGYREHARQVQRRAGPVQGGRGDGDPALGGPSWNLVAPLADK